MTDAIQTISLVEGLPSRATPNQTVRTARIRKDRGRQERIELAVGVSNLILCGLSGKGSQMEALRHMFTDAEYSAMMENEADKKEMVSEMQQLARLRRMKK